MRPDRFLSRSTRRAAALVLLAGLTVGLAAVAAEAHGGRAGDVEIEHPYATPTPPGAVNGAAYIAGMKNTGSAPDRLLRVASPAAQRSEMHTMSVDASGVMRMREVPEIALPPGERIAMKPGMGFHIMLIGLKQPLKEGDRVPLTMEFERGGKTEVNLVVQKPKDAGGAAASHAH